jgi:hypothetical protein
MANVGSPARGYYPDRTSNIGAVKDLFVKFTVGATPSTITQQTTGEILSITNTGTGAYTILFTQSYFQHVELSGSTVQASYANTGVCNVEHIADANQAKNGSLKILLTNAAGAATDAASGDVVVIKYAVQVDSITS